MITIPFQQTSVVVLPTYDNSRDASHRYLYPVYSATTNKLYCPYNGGDYTCSGCAANHPVFREACRTDHGTHVADFRAVLALTHPELVL